MVNTDHFLQKFTDKGYSVMVTIKEDKCVVELEHNKTYEYLRIENKENYLLQALMEMDNQMEAIIQ